ncbi:DUF2514 family protein [Paracandidimonas soli]|uniref:Uncharacterized protein DUF2514 n=1 Tax=Paracandidimonas soli TaxID=1917182 RepID=A0A4R3V9L9_9BURK|nr:DUF2514 family protein [Paracandidimonas soli]TCV01917.1 uncharacterized protein DUF2514 [Paracandidimonas soli]
MTWILGKLAGWRGYGAVAALSVALTWIVLGWRHDASMARIQAEHAQVLESIATASSDAMKSTLDEERRRYAALENARDNAEKMSATSAADAAAFRAANQRLRNRVNALAADARARYPALAEGGPTAAQAVDMLAYMLGRLGDAAGELAEYGDAARGAGLTCEFIYDSVASSAQP